MFNDWYSIEKITHSIIDFRRWPGGFEHPYTYRHLIEALKHLSNLHMNIEYVRSYIALTMQ